MPVLFRRSLKPSRDGFFFWASGGHDPALNNCSCRSSINDDHCLLRGRQQPGTERTPRRMMEFVDQTTKSFESRYTADSRPRAFFRVSGGLGLDLRRSEAPSEF